LRQIQGKTRRFARISPGGPIAYHFQTDQSGRFRLSAAKFQSINPVNEQVIAEHRIHSSSQIEKKLRLAESAFAGWQKASFAERTPYMKSAANLLRSRRHELSELMTREMGKPIVGAEQEIDKCADACDYFADNAEAMLQAEEIKSDASRSYVCYSPLGAVLAIMPWNFPFWQVMRFAAPNLMAGNVGVLKHAPNVCGCALAIEDIFRDAGFPDGVFTTLIVDTPVVAKIIKHPVIKAVTLTGSERAGRAVAAQAGTALKKTVLELGGSDPFLVLDDANISAVAKAAAAARCINSGQSCIAAKRFIVMESVADEFEAEFALAMSELKVGDPMRRETQIGPLARKDLLDNLSDQVTRSIKAGARVVVGGHHPDMGFFSAPAVLADVRPGMAVFDEETFGPVGAVIRATDEHDLLWLANISTYGLGASIWSKDIDRAERLANALEVGSAFINGPVKSDPRLPFGGIKNSGYGRELSLLGIREFVNAKTVWIK
jgi:succinate-semialdehyde dehydrogenase / glutarate-semialdehyde dehydrogenase